MPGRRSPNVTAVTPGSCAIRRSSSAIVRSSRARERRRSSLRRPRWPAVPIQRDARRQVFLRSGTARGSADRASDSSEMPWPGIRQITVSATWKIMTLVQIQPNRSVEPPAPRFLSCAWACAPVTFSAGRIAEQRGADNRQHGGEDHGGRLQAGIDPERQRVGLTGVDTPPCPTSARSSRAAGRPPPRRREHERFDEQLRRRSARAPRRARSARRSPHRASRSRVDQRADVRARHQSAPAGSAGASCATRATTGRRETRRPRPARADAGADASAGDAAARSVQPASTSSVLACACVDPGRQPAEHADPGPFERRVPGRPQLQRHPHPVVDRETRSPPA